MLELGDYALQAHRAVGELAAECADRVLAYGPLSAELVDAAGNKAEHFLSQDALLAALREAARPGDTILFKASHGMHLENVFEAFTAEP